jgi:hypothetical protein
MVGEGRGIPYGTRRSAESLIKGHFLSETWEKWGTRSGIFPLTAVELRSTEQPGAAVPT